MLEIPKWAPAVNLGNCGEVINRRRRTRGPFQRPSVPRIVSTRLTPEVRRNEVVGENENCHALKHSSNGDDQIPCLPASSGFVGVNSAGHSEQPRNMHEIECQVKSDEE